MKEEKTTWFRYSVNDQDIHEALVEEAGMVSLPQWMLFELLRSRREYRTLSWIWGALVFLLVILLCLTMWIW